MVLQPNIRFCAKDYWMFFDHVTPIDDRAFVEGLEINGFEILEVIEQPHQLLCRLDIKGKEVLVPLSENTLQKIDHRKKQVLVTLPDGLLDIYLT